MPISNTLKNGKSMFRCNASKNSPLLQTCCDLNINGLPEEGTQPAHGACTIDSTVAHKECKDWHMEMCAILSNDRWGFTYLLCFPLSDSIFALIPAHFGCCLVRALWFIGLLATQRRGDRCNNRRLDHPLEIWGRGNCSDCWNKWSVFNAHFFAELLQEKRRIIENNIKKNQINLL